MGINLIFLAGLVLSFVFWSGKAQTTNTSGMTLVFEDEFTKTTLDESKWVDCYWWTIDGCTNAGNNELEWYTSENVYVKNGSLYLEAREEIVVNFERDLFPYSSGMVTTGRNVSDTSIPPKFSFQYGKVEVRAKFPAGTGLWPAIWLLPVTHISRPEIDIFEMLGHETNLARLHVHYLDESDERDSLGHAQFVPDLTDGWQTIALDWQPDHIIWYLNNEPIWEVTDPQAIPDEPLYLILNLAVGGDYPGPPDEKTQFPTHIEIDYVRIWQ